jgi:hypothetical protein
MPIRCEGGCGAYATHCCAGLDVPMLHFCARCIVLHAAHCDAVKDGTAQVVEMEKADA